MPSLFAVKNAFGGEVYVIADDVREALDGYAEFARQEIDRDNELKAKQTAEGVSHVPPTVDRNKIPPAHSVDRIDVTLVTQIGRVLARR